MAGASPHRHGDHPHEARNLPGRSIRRIVVITALASLALTMVAPAPQATGADRQPPTVGGIPPGTTFYGRGWGHGVGMSQYGARGRALAGQPAAEVFSHFDIRF
jgi:hypothetical protein